MPHYELLQVEKEDWAQMKIAVVSACTESHYGIRKELIASFLERGHSVVAFGGDSETEWIPRFAERGVSYRRFSVSRAGVNPFQDLKTLLDLRRLYLEERPDIVFTYHAKGNIYGCMAARMAGVREVYSLVAGLGSVFRSRDGGRNLVKAVMTAEYRQALKSARKVFFQNSDDLSAFVDEGIVPEDKTEIVNGSGVDITRFSVMPFPEKFVFLFAGRLIRDKGILEFIDAARKVKRLYPEVRFVAIGDIDDNPTSLTYDDLSRIEGEGIVEFPGMQTDVMPFFRESSAFVLPSYHEGTPRAALEALAVGRPVILTDAPGCREVVRDGENGYMVPVRDPESLAAAMIRLVEQPALMAAMGQKSRAIAEEKYDVRKVNEVICNIMEL